MVPPIAKAPMSSTSNQQERFTSGTKTDYDELNTLWLSRETAIVLSYLHHHPNRDEWSIHFTRCLASSMVAGPPTTNDGAERTTSTLRGPRSLALAETRDDQVHMAHEDEIQNAKTGINAIWKSRAYRITLAYIIHPDREAWLVHFVSCLAKIAEGPAAATSSKSAPPTDVQPDTEQSPRLSFQNVSYNCRKWFRVEGGGTMYEVQLPVDEASTKFSLPAGAKLWTANFSKDSVLGDDGYRPVSESDLKIDSTLP